MDRVEWNVVFDASQRGPEWALVVVGVVAFAAGWTLWRSAQSRDPNSRLIGAGAIAIGSAVLLAATAPLIRSTLDRDFGRAIDSSPVVEGPVESFHPMPPGGHDTERFDVGGVHFEYSGWQLTQGFNHDRQHGGPIRAGMYVRINYASEAGRQSILRLAIRRSP